MALAPTPSNDLLRLLKKTQGQLVRNTLLDCASYALWWPVSVLFLGATAAWFGVGASSWWLAFAASVAWLLATIIYFLRARTHVLDAARWLDRVTDSHELFVSAASLPERTAPTSAAAHYLLDAMQKRLPTARVCSAALIGWKAPKQAGIAIALGMTSLVALQLAAGKEINSPTLSQKSAATGEPLPSQSPGLTNRLAESLRDDDSTAREQAQTFDKGALAPAPSDLRGASIEGDNNEKHVADLPVQAASPNNNTQAITHPGSTVTSKGRQAGDEKGESQTVLAHAHPPATIEKSHFIDLAVKSNATLYAQDRAGRPLTSAHLANGLAPSPFTNAPEARPENTPLPPSFGPQERNLVARYFHELNQAK